jgi:hypothetical protein
MSFFGRSAMELEDNLRRFFETPESTPLLDEGP